MIQHERCSDVYANYLPGAKHSLLLPLLLAFSLSNQQLPKDTLLFHTGKIAGVTHDVDHVILLMSSAEARFSVAVPPKTGPLPAAGC